MGKQFGRKIDLQIGSDGTGVNVSELRIRFEVIKNIMGAPDLCKLEIFNLSRSNQNKIQDVFDTVILNAGYSDNYGLLFQGEIRNVFKRKVGVDSITEVYAADSDQSYKRSYSNFTLSENASVLDVINTIVADMDKVRLGTINIETGTNKILGRTFAGASRDLLTQLGKDYNFNWSIQNGLLNCVDANRSLPTEAILISNRTGMIDAPVVTARGVDVATLLNWRIEPHALIQVESNTDAVKFGNLYLQDIPETLGRGIYKVGAVTYQGDTHSDAWYSFIEGLNIV